MPRSSSLKKVEDLSYETAFSELESIVNTLENEQRSLEESMTLYERGQALVKRCAVLLEQAELKVKELSDHTSSDDPED